jgi:hypothetical protein
LFPLRQTASVASLLADRRVCKRRETVGEPQLEVSLVRLTRLVAERALVGLSRPSTGNLKASEGLIRKDKRDGRVVCLLRFDSHIDSEKDVASAKEGYQVLKGRYDWGQSTFI